MKQLRAIVAALFAALLLVVFIAPAQADDSGGTPAGDSTTTTDTEPEAPAEEETPAEDEAPAEEAPAEEAPAEDEAPAEEAVEEEAADTSAVTSSDDGDEDGSGGGGADGEDDLDRPSANPGTGTTSGGQQVTIIIDSPTPGQQFNPGETVVVKGRVAIGTLGANVEIVYTLDVSGSTGGLAGDCTGDGTDDTIMQCQQAGALAINQQLTGLSGVQVGVASFDDGSYVNQGFVAPSDPAVATAINALVPTGGTNFDAGLQATLDLFATGNPANRRITYFMSDGFGTLTTGAGSPLQAAIDGGIQVNTFSIGVGAAGCGAGSPLADIASATGGVCTEVNDVTQIVAVLGNLRPAGITKVEVSINGGPPVEATVDLLGNFEATVGNIVVGDNTIVATVFTDDGTQVSADVVVQGVAAGATPAALRAAAAVHPATTAAGTLPVTGADSLPVAAIAALLLAVGAALVVVSRKATSRA